MRIALFFADGRAFFVGASLVTIAALLFVRYRDRRAIRALALLGVAMVALSATPLPYALYGVWLAACGAWFATGLVPGLPRRAATSMAITTAALCIVIIALEAHYHRLPRVSILEASPFVVIGDSLSAGMGQGENTWPRILRGHYGWQIADLSRAGATVHSAMGQAEQIPPGECTVLLEIGGNDLLDHSSAASFEAGLQRLLENMKRPERTLLMFELPLPPLGGGYGRAQRRLAAQYQVTLIPKRVLSRVLGASGATLDGLHFSEAGHRMLADLIASLGQRR